MADVKKGRLRFPIAFKLSLLVSAILVFSLGIIIFSLWFFFSSDAAKTAVADNDSINFRVAAAAETALKQIRSESSLLLGHAEGNGMDKMLLNHYFHRNPSIAAIVSVSSGGSVQTMINDTFTRLHEISDSLIIEYLNMRAGRLMRDDSETLLVNASPDFYGLPMLVARFPYASGNGLNLAPSVAIVFFSSGELADYLGYGANQSFLLNDSGELLVQGGDLSDENFASNPALLQLYADSVNHVMTSYRQSDEVFASIRRIDFGAALLTLIPATVVYEGINATTRRNLYLALSVWFISLLFVSLFSSRLTRRLGILQEAAQAIENGMYRYSISGKANDETGFLARKMNNMRTALINFERFTNKQIARLTRKGMLEPGGSTKNAVFLLSDIRSFTEISEKMDPAELVSFLNDYMESMVSCIMVTGGTIDKFIGDAILAHWGAITEEIPDGTDPANAEAVQVKAALRSALLMRASLHCFNQAQAGKNRPHIKIGCGISGGKVAAGLIGTDERLVYTVIGDAVNHAERAEAANKACGAETLITARLARLAGEDFITEEVPGLSGPDKHLALINVKSEYETKRLQAEMQRLVKINAGMARHFAGPDGPKTLRELRVLIGISDPEINMVVPDENEKKFKIHGS